MNTLEFVPTAVIDRIVIRNNLLWELLTSDASDERKREIIDILFPTKVTP